MRAFSFNALKESYQSRHEPEKYTVAAEGIWMLMLAVASLAMVVSIGYGAWQFIAPPEEAVITETTAGGITGFNRAQLSQVVEFYEKRQAAFEAMMSGE